MRVALYARVSTSDRDQDPETQLMALRDYCTAMDWQVTEEYVDRVSARDLAHRTAWTRLLDDGARRRFKAVVVFKLDRAFRSVKDMHDTLATWEALGVSFKSVREQFDTGTMAAEGHRPGTSGHQARSAICGRRRGFRAGAALL